LLAIVAAVAAALPPGSLDAAKRIPGTTGRLPYVEPLPLNPRNGAIGVVVLDPGHGTMDSAGKITGQGASGHVDGREVPEELLTLDYGMHLLAELRRLGVEVHSTRTYGRPWFKVDYRGHDQEKNNRLRAEMATALDADLFLRIHFDGSTNASDSGFSIWYNDQSKADRDGSMERLSLAAATAIEQRLAAAMEIDSLGIRRFDRPIYGFVHATQPAVLLELAFLSNDSDTRYVLREETLQAVTKAAARGIVDYLSSAK
jgi:N-acetylmuramoyl-L-alanine amidase